MKWLLFFLFLAGLAGCATNTERDFLCEAELGQPCTSIAEADGGGPGSATAIVERPEDTAISTLSQDPLGVGKVEGGFGGMPDGGFAYDTGRYRVPEVVGRLWIAPYLDDNGLLHESRYVHFVVTEARWVNR